MCGCAGMLVRVALALVDCGGLAGAPRSWSARVHRKSVLLLRSVGIVLSDSFRATKTNHGESNALAQRGHECVRRGTSTV